jgi:hypothetical protein
VVEEPLVRYRHVQGSMSSKGSTPRKLISRIKVEAMERSILGREGWETFTIWGAGRDGNSFYKLLSPEMKARVREMCDVDPIKIQRGYYDATTKTTIKVVHYADSRPPGVHIN